MEYFWSDGGNNKPTFAYRFLMREINDDIYNWCGNYPLDGPFERWHIIHNYKTSFISPSSAKDEPETPLIQFESKKAARMFRIAYSEYILENKSFYNLDD